MKIASAALGSNPLLLLHAHSKAGEVTLKMPKLRKQTFETAIIERYKRHEASIEESLIEVYLAGVSVRRVEDITEALWGTRVSSGTVSKLNQKIYKKLEVRRNKPIEGDYSTCPLPRLVIPNSTCLPPELCCLGISPKASNVRI